MPKISATAIATSQTPTTNAIVSGYGMVEYRWGMCANAAILEACE